MVKLLLDDDKPLLKEWWFGNQPIKNGGWTSRDVTFFFMVEMMLSEILAGGFIF